MLGNVVICDSIFPNGEQLLLEFWTTQNNRVVVFLEKADYIKYVQKYCIFLFSYSDHMTD